MQDPIQTLTMLETVHQAHWLADHGIEHGLSGGILAVTPAAAYACQKLGLTYLKLEDYAQVAKRQIEYTSVMPYYLEWEAWLDEWAQQAVPIFGENHFRPASAITHLLHTLFAEIWATAVNLHEFIQATQPAHIALWLPRIINLPWHLHPSVSPLTTLAPTLVSAHNIPIVDLAGYAPTLAPVSDVPQGPSGIRRWVEWAKHLIVQHPLIAEVLATRYFRPSDHLKSLLSDAPYILVSGYGYDLPPLVRDLRRQGARIVIVPNRLPPIRLTTPPLPSELKDTLAITSRQLLREPRLWELLEKCGIGHAVLWELALCHWWHNLVPELWRNYQHTCQTLRKHRYTAFVSWESGGNTLSGVISNAAECQGLHRYIYQHGSSSEIDARNWQAYLRHSETFLVYGQGSAEKLNQTCPTFMQPCARIIPVGSARLDALCNQSRTQSRRLRLKLQAGDIRPLILYIPTHFAAYGRSTSSELAPYPVVSYFELQQAILKLWNETPDVRLVYKDFAVANDPTRIMSDFVRDHIANAIVTNRRLPELIWAVDAIVLDHVITAIGEALLTNKPMVVYFPQAESPESQAKALLRKRAAVAETPEEFIKQVRAFLQAGQYTELKNPNTEFLEAYSTHLNDGNSAQRAAAILMGKTRP